MLAFVATHRRGFVLAASTPKRLLSIAVPAADDGFARSSDGTPTRVPGSKRTGTSASPADDALPSAGRPGPTPLSSLSSSPSPLSSSVVDAVAYRKEHRIKLRDPHASSSSVAADPFTPMTDFDATPFSDSFKRVLKAEGFTAPTPTQAQSWPIALQKRDIISVAKTGSGKTCGFLLPAFHMLVDTVVPSKGRAAGRGHMQQQGYGGGRKPSVLVLAPTRELAGQIEAEARKFTRSRCVSCVHVCGSLP
jgi:ATP-dependent RNA helicase DDX5/DBP2